MTKENLSNFIKRACEKSGFTREMYTDNNAPLILNEIKIFLFFGDYRAEHLLSSILLHKLKEKPCYLILCSFPGHSGLYPYIDEYWTIKDEQALSNLFAKADGFDNKSVEYNTYERSLLRYFENVSTFQDSELKSIFNDGFQSSIRKTIEYKLPMIPSIKFETSRNLDNNLKKIFIFPSKTATVWLRDTQETKVVKEDFWIDLINCLIKEKYFPVLWQNYATYDLSEFGNKCAYVHEYDLMNVLGVMRNCDCVLDVFSGISRLALIARCPYLSIDNRQRYFARKDYEIDDLCSVGIPKRYAFSFSNLIENDQWINIINLIKSNLNNFDFNKSQLPTTAEVSNMLSYDNVRKLKTNKLSMRFIREKL